MLNKKSISTEEFVVMWQKASSAKEVAAALSVPVNIVSMRACYLRSRGVKLRRFHVGRKRLDVKNLNEIIVKLENK